MSGSLKQSNSFYEILTLILFASVVVVHEIAKRYQSLYYRLFFFAFFFMVGGLARFYQENSDNIGVGSQIQTELKDIDTCNVVFAVAVNLTSFLLIFLMYNPEYINGSQLFLGLSSILLLICGFIAGEYMAYYNRTYKNNFKNFAYMKQVRLILLFFMMIPVAIESYTSNGTFITIFPYYLVYTLGFFRSAFSDCSQLKYSIFVIISLVIVVYFGFDLFSRFKTIPNLY